MIETYKNNELANSIFETIVGAGFGEHFLLRAVLNAATAAEIKESPLTGLDYRAKLDDEPGIASTFRGLAFDSENIRTQSTAIYEGDKPIGLMTMAIVPKPWIDKQRYFQAVDEGIVVRDFKAVSIGRGADFLIVPAWTILDPRYRYPKSIIRPGFQAFMKSMEVVQSSAPEDTYIEAVAMGNFPRPRIAELQVIDSKQLGTFVPWSELPFPREMLAVNAESSMASVSMAQRMGLSRIERVASSRSLGPVFAKEVISNN